jgi:uncharacterized protein YbjT (DUF2867 family)
MRILVTGATGTVGAAVVRGLLGLGAEPVAAVRNDGEPTDAPHRVRFDFTEPATYAPALAGADGLFLMRPPAISDAERYVNPVVEAAERAGVRRIAFLSVLGADKNPLLPHHAIERRLEAGALPYVLLRANNFMQNLAEVHADEVRRGEVFVPAGDGRTGFVDARDVGEAAARWLASGAEERAAVPLTGPEALTYGEVAAVLSDVLGRPVRYARPGLLAFLWRKVVEERAPLPFALVMAGVYTTARLGLAARVTDDLSRMLGRPPRRFRDFAEDYRARWAYPPR